jgi:uncharacterized protein YutE (UPF0331/DUF86 family)
LADDVILNKAEIIENCLRRIGDEYAGIAANLRANQTKQDSILLNLERACQAAIDMAMRLVRKRRLGLPKESRDAFDLIAVAGVIDDQLKLRMHGLVGFRDTAIHNYKKLDLDIVEAIITKHLDDFRKLVAACLKV